MPRDIKIAVEILAEHGLDLQQLIQDTHAETMITIGSLLDEALQLAISACRLSRGQDVDDRTFQKGGKLETLGAKIRKAHNYGLLNDVEFKDATILREIRNEFGHLRAKLNFDSPKIDEWVSDLSTFDPVASNQNNIFSVTTSVMEPLRTYVKKMKQGETTLAVR
jgi:DNA-binding MltR family transcriptional regulator